MRRLFPTLVLFAAAVLLSAGVAELVLRWWVGPPVHFKYPQPRYVPHPDVGHWLEPGQRSFNHDTPLRVNSVGIRGPEHPRRVPQATLRILALGDSETFGNGLSLEDTWPARLEHELEARTSSQAWEVINAGLSATDTWQHERMLRSLEKTYDFDAVILGFYVNDVTTAYEPRHVEERTNTWSKRIAYALKRSALLTAIWQTTQAMLLSGGGPERERRILTGEAHPQTDRAWDQVERSLVEIQKVAERREVPFVLLVLPRRDQVSAPDPLTGYNERVARIARRHGISIIDMLATLREAHDRHGTALFIPWDGHNSALANEVIAAELASRLLERGHDWIAKRSVASSEVNDPATHSN